MSNRIFIDIHAIQTVPPSCVNRDDTGSPKTAVYGGVERARISSQAWKHAMRLYFREVLPAEKVGLRTKQVPQLLAEEIVRQAPDYGAEKASKAAMEALKNIGIKIDDKSGTNSALFFISEAQIKAIAQLAVVGEKDKNAYKNAVKANPSVDIALFGRMVADDPELNYDAAAQVAHTISTHAVHAEYDYFTAVDDAQGKDQAGAAYLDTTEFNSATMYRYATVNVTELQRHLGVDTAAAVRGFIEAFVKSMPTGKQNTFANRTLPDMLYVTIRNDQPVNLSGAYEKAIRKSDEGYVQETCKALLVYADKLYHSFAEEPVLAFGCGEASVFGEAVEVLTMKDLLAKTEQVVAEYCKGEEV